MVLAQKICFDPYREAMFFGDHRRIARVALRAPAIFAPAFAFNAAS
jgi:hypothetical protein